MVPTTLLGLLQNGDAILRAPGAAGGSLSDPGDAPGPAPVILY